MTASLRLLNVSGALTLIGAVALWQLAVDSGMVAFDYLPAPSAVAEAVADGVSSGTLTSAAWHTLWVALAAWTIALVVGVALGAAIALWRPARLTFAPSIEVLRTLPVVAFVPVAVLIFGLSTRMEIAVAAWAALWPILVNTLGGVEAAPARLHEVAAVFRMSTPRRLRVIVLPAAAPLILVGARLGLSFALIIAVVAEMIGNPAGLGHLVVRMQQALRPEEMFAGVAMIGVLGIALNAALVGATRRAAPDMFEPARRA
jgi:ABC-type nitrate/sulfonate/bicarbonate transport system permease component